MNTAERAVLTELRLAYGLAWGFGVLFLALGSWLPLRFEPIGFAEALDRLRWPEDLSRSDFVLNVLITIPVSWALAGWIMPRPQGKRAAMSVLLAALAAQAALAWMVEFVQAWTPERIPSLGDVLAQCLGAVIGVMGWWCLGSGVFRIGVRLRSQDSPYSRAAWALSWYAAGFFVWCLLPANPVLSLGELAQRFRSGMIRLHPLAGLPSDPALLALDIGLSALACLPIGALAAVGTRVLRTQNPSGDGARTLVAACFCFPLMTEFLQVFIHGRVASSLDVLTGCLGVCVGWACTSRWSRGYENGLPRPQYKPSPLPWLAAMVVYTVFVTVVSWAPMDFDFNGEVVKPRLQQLLQAPLGSIGGDQSFALMVFVQDAALFVPAGCLAAQAGRASRSRFWPWLMLGMAVLLLSAVAIELGQVALPGRTPSLGESFARLLGAFAGAAIFDRIARV